jgi:7-cyano-7-deazaguanine synthase
MTAPAVILLSGGLDSSVLLHYIAKTLGRRPLHALSFRYGQKHSVELEMAGRQARAVEAVKEHLVVDLESFATLAAGASTLVDGGGETPDLAILSDEARRQPPTYVPNRNMILLALAAAAAEARGAAEVYYGAQAQDEYGYWDCTADFLERINHLLGLNRVKPVRILAPFVAMRKADEVRLALELGVDLAATWSCYRGGEVHCGTCPTCVERHAAFREAGVADPTRYA